MTRQEIKDGLQDIFRDIFDDETLLLTEDMTAENVPGWDSVNHIYVVIAAERRFRVKVTAQEAAALKNVGAFVDLLSAKAGHA